MYVAGGSTGNSIETTVVQLTADALGVNIEDVNTIQGDTAVTGFGAGAAGSRSGSMTAGAVRETATHPARAHRARSPRTSSKPRSRTSSSPTAARACAGTPAIGITLREIARLAYFEPAALPPGVPAGLEASARYTADTPIVWVNATHVCTCEVDVATGGVTLLRYIVSEDCGPMINPDVVEGQIAGGVVQGIGGALFEELAYDDDGNPLATTFMDYLVPSAAEVPTIEYGHIETPSAGPGGYKGVGEGGAIGAPPAVVNAVADALAPFGVTVDPPAADTVAHRRAPSRPPARGTIVTDSTDVSYDPYDVDDQRRSVSGVPPAARRGAALLQRAVRLLRGQPLRRRRARAEGPRDVHLRARGGILELIKANIEMPPGVIIFEDPPIHTDAPRVAVAGVHAEEDERARAQDPRVLRGAASTRSSAPAGFDFVADLGAQMPMRVIGMLLGIPEQDQEAIRDHVDAIAAHRSGQAHDELARRRPERRDLRRLHRLARRAPLRRSR